MDIFKNRRLLKKFKEIDITHICAYESHSFNEKGFYDPIVIRVHFEYKSIKEKTHLHFDVRNFKNVSERNNLVLKILDGLKNKERYAILYFMEDTISLLRLIDTDIEYNETMKKIKEFEYGE